MRSQCWHVYLYDPGWFVSPHEKNGAAEVKLIRSDESNNDDQSEAVITSMK